MKDPVKNSIEIGKSKEKDKKTSEIKLKNISLVPRSIGRDQGICINCINTKEIQETNQISRPAITQHYKNQAIFEPSEASGNFNDTKIVEKKNEAFPNSTITQNFKNQMIFKDKSIDCEPCTNINDMKGRIKTPFSNAVTMQKNKDQVIFEENRSLKLPIDHENKKY